MDLGDSKQTLLFVCHHLVVDGVSWRILLDDFINILKQLDNKSDIRLPLKTTSYQDWAEALQAYSKNDFEKEINYWESIENKEVSYNVDYNEGDDICETSNIITREIDKEIVEGLTEKAKEVYNIDLNEVLTIGLVLTLKNITDDQEIIVELERHGREAINENIDVSRTVGWFTSMFPAYFKIEHDDIDKNIKSLKEQFRNIPNKGLNYSILKYMNKQIKSKEAKNVRFNYLGDFEKVIDKEKLNISDINFGLSSYGKNTLTSLIDINVIKNEKIKISVEYSKKRYKYESIERLLEDYIKTLELILDTCNNKDYKEFTPSDFESIDISQEDLDSLFE